MFKIALTVFSALGLWIQSCPYLVDQTFRRDDVADAHFRFSGMPMVLRLVYTRFAAQETLSNKLEFEAEEEALRSVDHEHLPMQEVPDMGTNPQADHLIKKPTVDV